MLPAVSSPTSPYVQEEESLHMKVELGAKVIAQHRQAVGTMKFLRELFKLNMVQDVVILGCVGTYPDTQSEECLCCLISTTGTVLDYENIKPQMVGYFSQLMQILKEGKTTSQVRFMLQDVMDLRQVIMEGLGNRSPRLSLSQ
ncbi:hypothetical protein SKAU_G00133740 [Synaphobranchus kaupii]|uniref:MIF4G domain-containing protein n=1 Tax=Synaphobranchus kaupii TaxID=118154 RepID=A0A9Q1FR38_SYNKA|nr:hypothetical protein SKAU_G00133740 [Synaphobranchus kaupii]